MQFEWDPDKAAKNLKLHKVDFEVAQRVFEDPFHIDDIDDREDYGEERSNIIGMVDNRLLVVMGWRYPSHLRTKSEAI
jgi:uncharacterized DUF497 family protein